MDKSGVDRHVAVYQDGKGTRPINLSYQNNIKVYLNYPVPTGINISDWKQSLRDAMSAYNKLISYSNIRFTETIFQSQADIILKFKYDAYNGLAGEADLPLNGKPGNRIYFNTYYNSYTLAQKTMIAIHEIGHTLGFMHTDYSGPNRFLDPTPNVYFNTWQLIGSPSFDALSVYNSNIGGENWEQTISNPLGRGFTNSDCSAISYLYPYIAYINGQDYINNDPYDIATNTCSYSLNFLPENATVEWKLYSSDMLTDLSYYLSTSYGGVNTTIYLPKYINENLILKVFIYKMGNPLHLNYEWLGRNTIFPDLSAQIFHKV